MSRDINHMEHGRFAGDADPARGPGRNHARVSLCETDGTRLEMSEACGVPGMGRMRVRSKRSPAGIRPLPGHAARTRDQALRAAFTSRRVTGLGESGVSPDRFGHGPGAQLAHRSLRSECRLLRQRLENLGAPGGDCNARMIVSRWFRMADSAEGGSLMRMASTMLWCWSLCCRVNSSMPKCR